MPPITLLKDKRIVLGATGSIAVYKAIDLASKLTQAGALVDVVMTESAQRFVSPLTFQAVTGRPVYTDMWLTDNSGGLPTHIAHVGLGEGADLLAVIPATANTMAKLAQGMSDDLLSVIALAARCPIVLAPAMDGGMYEHPATQANVTKLIERGATIIEPEEGRFASGLYGRGRLPEREMLIGQIRRVLGREGALAGKHVVVSAGPTREAFDPVRFISNHSSGKQGYAIAQAALDAGADVTLISS
ncbi:MAG: bifunctional phosphopantothenoylcysteine decarboxylase/phosphopantothenate--cysteine ligase CoaBC, partial [Chloroflexota bacterium]